MRLPDLWFFIPALTLTSIGLLITSTVSPAEFSLQWKVALMGVLAALLLSQVDSELLYLFSKPFYLLITVLLALLILIGDPVRGSRRWFSIGSTTFQVSEFAKLALVLCISSLSTYLNLRTLNKFLQALGIIVIPIALIFLEPDLGSSIAVGIIGLLSLLVLKPQKRHIIAVCIVIVMLIPLGFTLLAPYQKARIDHFINPSKDPLGASYNQIQAVIAVGSGQFIGLGLGKGSQSRLQFLPEKQTDFFFATASEQLGFVGSVVIVLLYYILGWRALHLARHINSRRVKVLLVGSLGMLFFQPAIHMGINLGILPVTGIPLPFLSMGGSSLLVSWLCIGMVMSVEKDNREIQAYEIG